MQYQTSRHLWLNAQDDKIAVSNVNSDQRVLLAKDELAHLEAYCRGADLEGEIPQRLAAAELIVPVNSKISSLENSRQKVIQFTIDRFLASQQGISSKAVCKQTPNPLERLSKVREIVGAKVYRPAPAAVSMKSRTDWDDLKSLFDHVETFLSQDAADPGAFAFSPGFLSSTAGRPLARYDYEQQPCMPCTTAARIEYVRPKLKPQSRCLILGDDDLLGLYWSQTVEQPADIFELDTELIDFLQPQLRAGVNIVQRDLIKGLPQEFQHRYDVIFTDPMYRAEGMDLFMLCAASGLSKDPDACVYFTTQPDLIQDGKRFEERLERAGLIVCERVKNFSRYRFPNFARNMIFREFTLSNVSNQLIDGLLRIPYLYADLFVLKAKG